MIDSGLQAILIKVAGIGLTPKHLGKTLGEMQQTLVKLNTLYGSHVCGEGGEYESLTLDSPLFKSKIVLREVENVIHSDNDFATVAFLRVKDAYLESKSGATPVSISIPPLLEEENAAVRDSVLAHHREQTRSKLAVDPPSEPEVRTLQRRIGQWIALSNIQATTSESTTLEDEVLHCFELLKERLSSEGFTLAQCVNINLFLSSMDYFPRVNAVYSSFFGTSPPARACVAVDLPAGVRVRLDCIAIEESSGTGEPEIRRQSLHVQSQSYWAPANIGPYSQAIVAGERIFISGQIGLVPSSVALPDPRSLALEMALSTQHVSRVVDVLKNSWEGYNQGAIYWLDEPMNLHAIRTASRLCGRDEAAVKLFAAVKTLPKGALVEKQVLYHTGRVWVTETDIDGEESSLVSVAPILVEGGVSVGDTAIHWESSKMDGTSDGVALLCMRWGQ
ncbi:hypothetical protein AAF712_005274 [Marasmius tenuissimus]|uniref:Diphthamide synthase domain-containing protein n=1 Tax=Marasmius tenuissimus TaxID=585030 RepID=A0ABR3A2M1_9AGAR